MNVSLIVVTQVIYRCWLIRIIFTYENSWQLYFSFCPFRRYLQSINGLETKSADKYRYELHFHQITFGNLHKWLWIFFLAFSVLMIGFSDSQYAPNDDQIVVSVHLLQSASTESSFNVSFDIKSNNYSCGDILLHLSFF